jgi:hypothetical protein
MTLDEIALRHLTDKASTEHNYMNFYEQFFAPKRDLPIRILEIGVGEGCSLRTWQEYFPNAEIIIGIDNSPYKKDHGKNGLIVEIGDQKDHDFLLNIGKGYGPFDFILDDGGHCGDAQIISLQHLIHFVKLGGYYIIEDLGCPFIGGKPRLGSAVIPLTLIAGHMAGNKPINDPIISSILSELESICFYYEACVMKIGKPTTDYIKKHHSSAEFSGGDKYTEWNWIKELI